MIKAVIFDFGQTLVDSADGFRKAEKEAQDRLFKDLSLALKDKFLDNYRRIRQQFHDRSNFSRKSIWNEVYYYHCLAADPNLLEKWETQYWDTVKANTTLFPEAGKILEALTSQYAVALITNTQGQKQVGYHRISQFPELEKYFQVVIVAGEGNIPAKPDPEPFRLCLQKLAMDPSEAVYVGDDFRIDICGAKDAGLHPVWLKHHLVKRTWPEVETEVPVITSLDELLQLEKLFRSRKTRPSLRRPRS
jgi:putative hydrolase of the HAD superfamily